MGLTDELAFNAGPKSKEENIKAFFSHHQSVTRQDCIVEALRIAGGHHVEESQIQGAWSYTLFAGPQLDTVVQFRPPSTSQALPIGKIAKACEIHNLGDEDPLVARVEFKGLIGYSSEVVEIAADEYEIQEEPGLAVYVMDRMPGMTHAEFLQVSGHAHNSDEARMARRTFVIDFARFMAQSWNHPLYISEQQRTGMRDRCLKNLGALLDSLPARFHPAVSHCMNNIGSVFTLLPITLIHLDLHGTNTLVESDTCHLTAVIDWAGAEIAPFGVHLEALQTYTGYLHLRDGWVRYADYEQLHAIFWGAFWVEVGGFPTKNVADALETVKVLGLLMLKGFDLFGHTEIFHGEEPLTPSEDEDRVKYNTLILDGLLVNAETKFVDF